jgi:uncharacterized protein (DUF2235 family)
MKRIVILIDGTWDDITANTNVAKLNSFIKTDGNGPVQKVFYHTGVGATSSGLRRQLALWTGFGLKKLIKDCYKLLVENFEDGDEIYIFGFSRGAYAARALAGMIGASGVQRHPSPEGFAIAWSHYRVKPALRKDEQSPGSPSRIKCVGVWDTVGAYGIPAGFGLASLARYLPLLLLGFHDTSFGEHIDVGLHAVAVDERRREFVPTFWTIPKGKHPQGQVEQTWFSGMHDNVGGGRPDARLSDIALIWMIARVQALTGLEFDVEAIKASVDPNIDGEVYDSTAGLPLSRRWPHIRKILSSVAIQHGYFRDRNQPEEMHINERVHWSVQEKRGRPCTVFGVPNTAYNPPNLPPPAAIPPDRIAAKTPEEQALIT